MCCCGKPSINGQPNAYSWDGKSFMTNKPNPPALQEGEELVYDLPGRCGGTDSHSYHLRIVKQKFGGWTLAVRHGGGDERHSFGHRGFIVGQLERLEEPARYWLLMNLYHMLKDTATNASAETGHIWRKAAAEKRIRVRKYRGREAVKVWIEPEVKEMHT